MTEAKAVPTGNKNEYKVTFKVDAGKVWIDDKGNDIPAKNMNDYIDIGVFAANSNNKEGRSQVNPLYLKKYKLTMGQHTISVVVKGKPVTVGIDPYAKLIDRQPNDNMKDL
ncbi:MAG: family transporter protein [Mucilaginibacter sp.]|nr:family transporter protein [Mucilaginibacter sp.]